MIQEKKSKSLEHSLLSRRLIAQTEKEADRVSRHLGNTSMFQWGERRLRPKKAHYDGQTSGDGTALFARLKTIESGTTEESGASGSSESVLDKQELGKHYDKTLSLYLSLAECTGVRIPEQHEEALASTFRTFCMSTLLQQSFKADTADKSALKSSGSGSGSGSKKGKGKKSKDEDGFKKVFKVVFFNNSENPP